MFRKFLHFLRNIAAEVPEEIAVCEFDCDKSQCLLGDWSHCERRLKVQAPQPPEPDRPAGE